MNRVRVADDFKAIRLGLDELRRERQQCYSGEPVAEEPDAAAHVPRHIVRRYLGDTRRTSSR